MKYILAMSLLGASCVAGAAMAGTQIGDAVTVTGFGTVGVVSANSDQAAYRSEVDQFGGTSGNPSFGIDSRFGLDIGANVTQSFRLVTQVLARRREPKNVWVESLYGELKLPASVTVKAGRIVNPTFMLSDSRSVGYAAHWLRAPQEVYQLYPASHVDGGQIMYRGAAGNANVTAQFTAGKVKSDFLIDGVNGTLDGSKSRSINLLVESGNWLWRAGQAKADYDIDAWHVRGLTDKFSGLGAQYDNGTAILMSEFVKRQQSGPYGNPYGSNSWYISGGWRVKRWTPYLTVSRWTPDGTAFADRRADTTTAAGVRWDVMKDIALKGQVQRTKGGYAFIHATPAFLAQRPNVTVLSLALDFIL